VPVAWPTALPDFFAKPDAKSVTRSVTGFLPECSSIIQLPLALGSRRACAAPRTAVRERLCVKSGLMESPHQVSTIERGCPALSLLSRTPARMIAKTSRGLSRPFGPVPLLDDSSVSNNRATVSVATFFRQSRSFWPSREACQYSPLRVWVSEWMSTIRAVGPQAQRVSSISVLPSLPAHGVSIAGGPLLAADGDPVGVHYRRPSPAGAIGDWSRVSGGPLRALAGS
jgi:hypothetical protein